MRLTKRVFGDLAIWMMGFGLLIGLVFPFFMVLLGIDASIALSWWFFSACVIAGLIVGGVNIRLATAVVGRRLRMLADHMVDIEHHLHEISRKGELFDCDSLKCHIAVDSADAIGESSAAFNTLVDTLARSMKTEMAIRTYTQMLTSHLDTASICANALGNLLAISHATGGAVLVEMDGRLQTMASTLIKQPETLQNHPKVLDMLKADRPVSIDIPQDIRLDGIIAEFPARQVVLEPIRYKQVPMGVIVLASNEVFLQEFTETLELFATSLALALNNAMTHDQVQKLAAIDPLTGLYNRRFGLTRLHEEYVRAVKTKTSLGLVMFDIDKFKHVNDTYGHAVGDRVIRAVASTVRSALREGDILVRIGGDEFFAVLLGSSSDDVQKLAEKVRRLMEEKQILHGDQAIKVTLSLGGSSFPECPCDSDQELLDVADRALYVAKESGRNQVVLFSSLH